MNKTKHLASNDRSIIQQSLAEENHSSIWRENWKKIPQRFPWKSDVMSSSKKQVVTV